MEKPAHSNDFISKNMIKFSAMECGRVDGSALNLPSGQSSSWSNWPDRCGGGGDTDTGTRRTYLVYASIPSKKPVRTHL